MKDCCNIALNKFFNMNEEIIVLPPPSLDDESYLFKFKKLQFESLKKTYSGNIEKISKKGATLEIYFSTQTGKGYFYLNLKFIKVSLWDETIIFSFSNSYYVFQLSLDS